MGLVKAIMKRTEMDYTSFEEAFSAFRSTRNCSGISPNQLFFLRNVRDPKLPSLTRERDIDDMVKARDMLSVERAVRGEDEAGLPSLMLRYLVRGQDPKSGEESLGGRWRRL